MTRLSAVYLKSSSLICRTGSVSHSLTISFYVLHGLAYRRRRLKFSFPNGIEIIVGYPFNNRNTDRVAKSKQGLIERNVYFEISGAHETGASAGRQKPHCKFALARRKQDLPPASTARRSQTSGNPICAQFCHRAAIAHAPKNCSIGDLCPRHHAVRLCPVFGAHLVEQIVATLSAPPYARIWGQIFDYVRKLRV